MTGTPCREGKSQRRTMKRFLLSVVCALAVASAACDETLSSITGPTPNLDPTLTSIQKTIFSSSDPSGRLACVAVPHRPGRTPASNLVLTRRALVPATGRACEHGQARRDSRDSRRPRQQLSRQEAGTRARHCGGADAAEQRTVSDRRSDAGDSALDFRGRSKQLRWL